jgi:hypothetical protein
MVGESKELQYGRKNLEEAVHDASLKIINFQITNIVANAYRKNISAVCATDFLYLSK